MWPRARYLEEWERHAIDDPVASRPAHVLRLFRELAQLQGTASTDVGSLPLPVCGEDERLIVVSYRAAQDNVHGFAAIFQHVAGALAIGWATGRKVVEHSEDLDDSWVRAPRNACNGRGVGIGCYFRPLADCVYAPSADSRGRAEQGNESVRFVAPPRAHANGSGVVDPTIGTLVWPGEELLPDTLSQVVAAPQNVLHVPGHAAPRSVFIEATSGGRECAPRWFREASAAFHAQQLLKGINAGASPSVASDASWFAAFEDYLFRPLRSTLEADFPTDDGAGRLHGGPQARQAARLVAQVREHKLPVGIHVRLGDTRIVTYRRYAAKQFAARKHNEFAHTTHVDLHRCQNISV